MGKQKEIKLNRLQSLLPEGLLVDAGWLQRHGYSSALRSKYVAHRWLDQVVRGVYRRPPAKLSTSHKDEGVHWEQIVISLQTLLESRFTVGGRTALELQGFGHYLSTGGPREIHLYGVSKAPAWVSKFKLKSRFIFHNSEKLFKGALRDLKFQDSEIHPDVIVNGHGKSSFIKQTWGHWEWPLVMSSAERATLELLDEVPQHETFHQVDVLMEGLRNLSPRRLHILLLNCRSIKAKRLFFWFAERHDHAWLKSLDRSDIDLGRGKRMLVRGGRLDKKFNITVPENIHAGS